MGHTFDNDDLIAIRRELHRYPEPSWCEYWTTARIVEALERIDVDRMVVGPAVLDAESRRALPDRETSEEWLRRAGSRGVSEDLRSTLARGHTGCLAEVGSGEPVICLRVDIDALPITESSAPDHRPAAHGFRSANEGWMHACGHDAHAAIGIGVLDRLASSDRPGTVRVLFQPAEEVAGGGAAMAGAGVVDDVDVLLGMHVGLDRPTGTVVGGFEGFLAMAGMAVTMAGTEAHAGAAPETGANAIAAMATAIEGLHGIPRHAAGATRVNIGTITGGTAANIVPAHARARGEVRGETTALMESMRDRATARIEAAASLHGCSATVDWGGEAPSASSDERIATIVAAAAGSVSGVSNVEPLAQFGASEDATYLMRRVQARGGAASYVGIGTDHPGGHHTPTFDVDERSIGIGVDVLEAAIVRLLEQENRDVRPN